MRYVVSRLGQTVFTIFLVSIALFLILRSVPGDPAVTLAGPDAPPEAVAAIRAEYGFDQPAVVQYLTWLGNIVQGDFGESIVYRESVVSLALEALHPSLELISFSMFLGLVIGIHSACSPPDGRGAGSTSGSVTSPPGGWACPRSGSGCLRSWCSRSGWTGSPPRAG